MDLVEVAIKSAWWSKVNWTQIIAMVASLGVVFGLNISPEDQAKIVATIQALSGFATIILRTWFTTTITPASANKV
jgi:uncharacterized protein (DUF697 family)